MKKLTLLGLAFSVFIFLAVPSHALKIVNLAEFEGKTFYPSDTVDLGIVLLNNESRQLNLTVEQFLTYPGINPIPLYEQVTIGAGNNTLISDFSFDVYDYSKPGMYIHSVRVYEDEKLVADKTSEFSVKGTIQFFGDYDLITCTDVACSDVTSIFDAGETVYIYLESDENPTIEGYVDRPDGGLTNVFFTNGVTEFVPAYSGEYKVNVILSKDGFSPEKIEKDITVVGSAANLPGSAPVETQFIAILAVAAVAAIVIIAAILFFKKKGK
ncbi:MAG: hypothetical protein NTU57_04805 [Candidatus Aenigmarchaeota archaeon]|nr:hypothetical protein [Candidatus Aenigmarchaeota archaeon]